MESTPEFLKEASDKAMKGVSSFGLIEGSQKIVSAITAPVASMLGGGAAMPVTPPRKEAPEMPGFYRDPDGTGYIRMPELSPSKN